MIERHHDYVLRNVTVTAGQSVQYVVRIDSDAPFALRQILVEDPGNDDTQGGLQFVIQGYDDRRYMAGTPLNSRDTLIRKGPPFIIYPQITFATQGAMLVTITALTGHSLTGAVVVFRGTKLFNEGTVFAPTYPPKFAELAFRYAYQLTVPLGTSVTPSVLSSQPLAINSDADFTFRMASAYVLPTGGDSFDPTATDVVLRDQYGKPYSSDSGGIVPGWVPLHLLFPVAIFQGFFTALQTIAPDVSIYPEIYVQRSALLLLDIRRSSGATSNDFVIVLHGSKVFPLQ